MSRVSRLRTIVLLLGGILLKMYRFVIYLQLKLPSMMRSSKVKTQLLAFVQGGLVKVSIRRGQPSRLRGRTEELNLCCVPSPVYLTLINSFRFKKKLS